MITEDYVSFETAKLLKEKGFDEECIGYYNPEKELDLSLCGETNSIWLGGCISAPTLQMAMKWLRETNRIDIEVRTYYLDYLKKNDTRYYSGKILKGSEDVIHTIYAKDTYEEVCEASIKYCLENLIDKFGN